MYWRLAALFAVLFFLQGCAEPEPKELPAAEPKPPVANKSKPVVAEAQPSKLAPIQVVILVSEKSPAYSEVANALAKELGKRANIRYLKGNQVQNIKMLSEYKNDKRVQLVSIGLSASVAAKALTDRQVVFCQVFNYQDYGLVSDSHKGVSMLPSITQTFSVWRSLAPKITDIAVITGSGFGDVIKIAKAEAKKAGIVLHHEVVNSDKEFQYSWKKMVGKVQGYWLLPDNRVLSGNVLRDVMTFSIRNSKQVAVFSEELLNLGGLFSVVSDTRDVAQQVLSRLEQAEKQESMTGPDITYPDKLNLRINSVMAERLNLKIPEQYKVYANAPK